MAATTRAAPGPVYDNGLRLLARRDLAAICGWLGVTARPEAIDRGEALPAATLHADVIAQVGPGRLTHVEFVRAPEADMARRMLEYRARIMTLHPGYTLTQHVVVLDREPSRPSSRTAPSSASSCTSPTCVTRTRPSC